MRYSMKCSSHSSVSIPIFFKNTALQYSKKVAPPSPEKLTEGNNARVLISP
jgi:hypothetical protein